MHQVHQLELQLQLSKFCLKLASLLDLVVVQPLLQVRGQDRQMVLKYKVHNDVRDKFLEIVQICSKNVEKVDYDESTILCLPLKSVRPC